MRGGLGGTLSRPPPCRGGTHGSGCSLVKSFERPFCRAKAAGPVSGQWCSPSSVQVEKRRVSLPRVLSTPPVAGTVCHAYDREVHLRCELAPGYYLAVPSTFLKDVPGQFLLRVFSSGRVSLR